MALTRRHLIAAAAASAAPLVSSGAKAASRYDVIIIGAGLSGLNAAMLLQDQGLRPVVLEAAGEVGGRVKTIKTAEGPIDVGASQIGRGYARAIDACRRLNLKLITEDRDLLTFGAHYKDTWIDNKTWASSPLNQCVGDERAIPPLMMGSRLVSKYNPLVELDDWLDPKFSQYDVSLRKLLESRGHSAQAIELAALSTPGISIDGTSVLRMWQEEVRGGLERKMGAGGPARKDHPFGEGNDHQEIDGLAAISNIEGGCQRLPLAMAERLGDAVRLNKVVARLEMTDRSARVTCEDGEVFTARFVISAIPFTRLRKIAIEAKPNPIATQAITQMPYANTARLYLTTEPFWLDDGLAPSVSTDGPLGMFWAIDNPKGTGAHRAMIVMVGPVASAISAHGPDSVAPFLLDELARLRPASKGRVRVNTYKDWALDPLQLGCGFSLAPGQVNAFARDMNTPWQVLHFAGEHTRRVEFGMESALESGERAALEIISRA